MPKYYGTGLYGRGNYSASTNSVLAAAQGALAQTGKVASVTWQCRLPAAAGIPGVTGQGAALRWQAMVSAAGLYGLAGDMTFAKSNIWSGAAAGAGGWTPRNPADNSWTPAAPGSQNWSKR